MLAVLLTLPIRPMVIDGPTAIAGVGAFAGALVGVGTVSAIITRWLHSRFGNIYKAMHEHEIKDMERFEALRIQIRDAIIQAQAATIENSAKVLRGKHGQ